MFGPALRIEPHFVKSGVQLPKMDAVFIGYQSIHQYWSENRKEDESCVFPAVCHVGCNRRSSLEVPESSYKIAGQLIVD